MKKGKTDKLTQKDIVVYALYVLGGWQKRVHTEDVALKCYELAPPHFSWVKYPQYPDLAPVRFVLEAATKPKNGALVKGESERKKTVTSVGGRMLTAAGIEWIKANKVRIERSLGKRKPIVDRLPAHRKLKQLAESMAFKKFTNFGGQAEVSHSEFAESLVCTVNTRAELLNDRLDQLYSIAEELGRGEIKDYVSFCRRRFRSILDKEGSGGYGKRQNSK